MGLKLEKVVPLGRSLNTYIKMFNLNAEDLKLKILDCAGGPASFNTEMTKQGYHVISCDPVYQFSGAEIFQRFQETYPLIIDGLTANLDQYIWKEFASPTELGESRTETIRLFLEDFPVGLSTGRYAIAELPSLPFPTGTFDLALCSHFLFLYSDHFSEQFHLQSIAELCRVAREVRIFPLLNLSCEPSPYVIPVINTLKNQGYQLEIQPVNYEFQRGGNQLLRISYSPDNS